VRLDVLGELGRADEEDITEFILGIELSQLAELSVSVRSEAVLTPPIENNGD